MPRDHHAAHDDRRRGDRHHPRIGIAHAVLDADRAVVSETGARNARARVHRHQTSVQRALDDPRGAGLGRINIRRGVIGHAPAGGGIGNLVVGDLGIIGPLLLARRRVDREQPVTRRAHIKGVADLQRRRFRAPAFIRQVARAEGPGPLKALHIVLVDLVERRIPLGAVRTAPGRPIGADLQHGRIAHAAVRSARHGAEHPRLVRLSHHHPGDQTENDDGRQSAQDQLAAPALTLQRREAEHHRNQQHQRRHHARDQGPAVQPDLPHRPDDGADEDGDIEPGAEGSKQGQQPARHDHQQTDNQIVGRAAKHDQLASADSQRQPDQGDDDP